MEDYGARVCLVENGVDLDYYQLSRRRKPPRRSSSFTASFDTFSNQDGADFLVREIWPRIKTDRPGVQLWLVGKDPPERMRALDEAGRRHPGDRHRPRCARLRRRQQPSAWCRCASAAARG